MYFTTDQLISSVESRTLAPISQGTFATSDLIAFANEELQLKLVPDILSAREDFFLRAKQINLVAGVSDYTVPERCTGNNFKTVYYVDQNNNRYILQRYDISELPYQVISDGSNRGFYLRGDTLVMVPTPTVTNGYLELWYYERASDLVEVANCGLITLVQADTPNVGEVTFTVNADLTANTQFDFLSGLSPFLLKATDIVPVSTTATTVVVQMQDVDNQIGTILPQVGDYICPRLKACIPMVPQEFHPLLAEMTAERVLTALGHMDKLQSVQANIEAMRSRLFKLISNRVEQKSIPIINYQSLLRYSGFGAYRGMI